MITRSPPSEDGSAGFHIHVRIFVEAEILPRLLIRDGHRPPLHIGVTHMGLLVAISIRQDSQAGGDWACRKRTNPAELARLVVRLWGSGWITRAENFGACGPEGGDIARA